MKLFFIIIFLTILSPTLIFAQNESLDKLIKNIIKRELDFDETPGISIGIIDPDSSYIYNFGETQKGNKQTPDANTIYEIGSATKVFTTALLTIMEHQNLLTYEDTIGQYFSELRQPVTLLDLANHSSGFPRLPHNFGSREQDTNQPYAYYTRKDLLFFLEKYVLAKPSGENYAYSHTGYALLTEIIEEAGGANFDKLLKKYLFNQLEMNDTRTILNDEQQIRLAQGNSLAGEVPAWKFSSFEGALGLKSTVNDLLKFLTMHLENDNELNDILQKNFERQHASNFRSDTYSGLGWHIQSPRRRAPDVYIHVGATHGCYAFIALAPHSHTAVVVLSNSKKSISNIGQMIFDTINFNWRKRG